MNNQQAYLINGLYRQPDLYVDQYIIYPVIIYAANKEEAAQRAESVFPDYYPSDVFVFYERLRIDRPLALSQDIKIQGASAQEGSDCE